MLVMLVKRNWTLFPKCVESAISFQDNRGVLCDIQGITSYAARILIQWRVALKNPFAEYLKDVQDQTKQVMS